MAATSATARTEFAAALAQIASERGIEVAVIIDAIKQAIEAAYRKDFLLTHTEDEYITEDYQIDVNPDTGESKVYHMVDGKRQDVTPPGFGRIAAQTAKQVILQKVREAEKDAVIADYSTKIGTLVTGTVIRFDEKMVIVDIGRGQGFMPPEEQMRGEFYRINTRLTFYIKDIRETMRGKTIIVSRADKQLVAKLFEREVPEVGSGAVEVVSIAREAGIRTKIAVNSTQEGVDPVGSCVGQKGVRVQEVIRELNNEKIDIIQFSNDLKTYMQAALAPAENLQIELDEKDKRAVVTCPEDQLSLAIGRGGQNARLAARLTGFHVTIKSGGEETVVGESEFSPEEAVIEPVQEEVKSEENKTEAKE